MSYYPWIEDVTTYMGVLGRLAKERPPGLGFCPILSIFGTLVPEIKTHPKHVELIRNNLNMNGTWCKAHFIPEKLMARM